MNKIITDKLIEEKLKEKGLSMYDGDDNALAKLQDYYEFELTDNYNRTPDYSIFAESTADGYEVWVATSGDGRNICINEDVYYHDSDLSDPLYDAMFDYNELIYVDDLEAYYVQDAVDRAWEAFITEMIDEVENKLIDQGYEHENKAEVA
ncbi:MAG: hypothetical protein GY787_04200 [Alteromonadales bacterium]|nr:hypothetical protein [Alteromonadales bacterium]